MLAKKFAFVDIETTGGSFIKDRVIEIGILRVEDGNLVQTYETLINPETYLSPFITQITGITEKDLETAPNFSQVKENILEILEDCVFVAHNVRFDYGFLKTELKRFGIPFNLPQLCTVRLSRALFPRFRHHNLDSLIERFGFECANRHRAMSDANVLWQFYQTTQKLFPIEKLIEKQALASNFLTIPQNLSQTELENLPQEPGVYIFYGENSQPLYVGKSVNIKERVLSHFRSDHSDSKELRLKDLVYSLDTITTHGELGALLKESELIKKLQPLYNRLLREKRTLVLLNKVTKNQINSVEITSSSNIETEQLNSVLGIFKTKTAAKNYLEKIAKEHNLCGKLLSLEKTSGACFNYHLGKCRGVCVGEESQAIYNLRFDSAFVDEKLKAWPFSGPIMIKEENSQEHEGEVFIVDKWCLLGSFSYSQIRNGDFVLKDYSFDLDTYKILTKQLSKQKLNLEVIDHSFLNSLNYANNY